VAPSDCGQLCDEQRLEIPYRYRYLDGWREKETRAALVFGRCFEKALEAYFWGDDCGASLYREWGTYREAGFEYKKGETWDRLVAATINQIESAQFPFHSGIRFPQNGCTSCSHIGLCLDNQKLTRLPRPLEGSADLGAFLFQHDCLLSTTGFAAHLHIPSAGDVRGFVGGSGQPAEKKNQSQRPKHGYLVI
jgi:hypothetical protein